MSDSLYTYAVTRIHAMEPKLLDASAVEILVTSKSYDECMRLLADHGWGDGNMELSTQRMLAMEREKTWSVMKELVEDMSVFDVFLYANDYHNLKAAIKMVYTNSGDEELFLPNGTVEPKCILRAVQEHESSLLPEVMRTPAEEAYSHLSHTGDGQMCDVILDRAALDAILAAGNISKNDFIQAYAEVTVAAADIKTAVRASRTGKTLPFIKRALAVCGTLDVDTLAQTAVKGMEAMAEYLGTTDYADAVSALEESPSAFERWCDNMVIQKIRPQQFQPFGLGPLAAYILGRENEIKTVRIILSGKYNQLPEEWIRERVREMYV